MQSVYMGLIYRVIAGSSFSARQAGRHVTLGMAEAFCFSFLVLQCIMHFKRISLKV